MSQIGLYETNPAMASQFALATTSTPPIYPIHLDDLRKSGLTDSTVQRAGIYSCIDPTHASDLLGRSIGPILPAMVFPFFNFDGYRTGYHRLKPSFPRSDATGRLIKYEAPSGQSNAPYFPPGVRSLIEQTRCVVITEGEKKALAASQYGFPAIGLSGVWGWSEGSTIEENGCRKKLLSGLSVLPWEQLEVTVCFDSDANTNYNVRRAEAALAAQLKQQGARVKVARLPPRCDGTKAGIDDFLVDYGVAEFNRLLLRAYSFHIERWMPLNRWERPLDVFRNEMKQARLTSLRTPQIVSFDGSPVGSGKSFADREIMRNGRRTLTLLPVHANLRECAEELRRDGFDAHAYGKLDQDTCQNWGKACKEQAKGLPVTLTICPDCPFRNECRQKGYHAQRQRAEQAQHAFATHERAHRNLNDLLKDRDVLFVHEDVTRFLRPSVKTSIASLDELSSVSELASNHAAQFRDFENRDFFAELRDAAGNLAAAARVAKTVSECSIVPRTAEPPVDWYLILSETVAPSRSPLNGDALRVALDALLGKNQPFLIPAYQDPKNQWGPTPGSILAVWQTKFAADSVIWLEDATANFGNVERLLPNVCDRTPSGIPTQQQLVHQIPVGVTNRNSMAKKAINLLRSVVNRHPKGTTFGVIGHLSHMDAVEEFAKLHPGTVVKYDYFRSGRDRASNDWTECKVLVVLGTPRVPPYAIRDEAIRLGYTNEANDDGHWAQRYWIGATEDGREYIVETGHYLNPAWQLAYLNVVTSLLKQAIGRSRFLLPEGVSQTYVFSKEPLQLPLLDPSGFHGVQDTSHVVFEALTRLAWLHGLGKGSAIPLNSSYNESADSAPQQVALAPRKDGWGVSTEEISAETGIPARTVRELLNKLTETSLVKRIGARKGWLPIVP